MIPAPGWIVTVALLSGSIPLVIFALGLRKTDHFGPMQGAELERRMSFCLRLTHILAATFAAECGFTLVYRSLFVIGLVPCLLIGYPVGVLWSRWRLKRFRALSSDARSHSGAGDASSSVTVAGVAIQEAYVPPLPCVADVLIIIGCETAGILLASGIYSL